MLISTESSIQSSSDDQSDVNPVLPGRVAQVPQDGFFVDIGDKKQAFYPTWSTGDDQDPSG